MRAALCHPTERHHALGRCARCYFREYDKSHGRTSRPSRQPRLNVRRYRQLQRSEVVMAVERLKDNPCTDCGGWFHPAAMHFDHLPDRGEKRMKVSHLANRGYNLAAVLEEIAKCELVCANCHAVRTVGRLG